MNGRKFRRLNAVRHWRKSPNSSHDNKLINTSTKILTRHPVVGSNFE